MNQKQNNRGKFPKFMVDNWTTWRCQSSSLQGQLFFPDPRGPSLCSLGSAGRANAGFSPWTPRSESWTPRLRVTACPGSEPAAQGRGSCPARWGLQNLRLWELHRRRCPNRSATFMNPGCPTAGAVRASWEHRQPPSDNDPPVRFMAAISSGGAD